MRLVVVFVLEGVFPESSLPNATTPVLFSGLGCVLFNTSRFQIPAREFFLQPGPAGRKIAVTPWQCPHRMHVVRKQDNGIDVKRPSLFGFTKNTSKDCPGHDGVKHRRIAFGLQRKKERSTRDVSSAVIRHSVQDSHSAVVRTVDPACLTSKSAVVEV